MTPTRCFLFSLLLCCAGPNGAWAQSAPEARQLALRALQDRDCGEAAMASFPESLQRFEARLLEREPPERHAAARAGREAAIARRSADCAGLAHKVTSASVFFDPATNARIEAAAAQGDALALLLNRGSATDAKGFAQLTAQLIDNGDAEAIARIGWELATRPDLLEQLGVDRAALGLGDVWVLLACDFGLDCGANSRVVDHMCLMSHVCGYEDLDSALRAARDEPRYTQTLQARDALLQRIRAHGGAGVFPKLTSGS